MEPWNYSYGNELFYRRCFVIIAGMKILVCLGICANKRSYDAKETHVNAFLYVSCTPFGIPVVPEEHKINAR